MNVLITGAAGKTGKHLIQQLNSAGIAPSVVLHTAAAVEQLADLELSKSFIGSFESPSFIENMLADMDVVYLIMPNMYAQEDITASAIIEKAARSGVKKIVYHSVLHPQVEAMPHHWKKNRAEEILISSNLNYTILQPTAYMQNILGYRNQINNGIYAMPYPVSSQISLVDLKDVTEIAAKVITDTFGWSDFATFELVGTDPLSQDEVASVLSQHLQIPIIASQISIQDWREQPAVKKMPEYTRNTLEAMFKYYSSYGLKGSAATLKALLGRAPTSLAEFLKREYIN
jgi:uncharacterized protein YbjT (DUF2867 family)